MIAVESFKKFKISDVLIILAFSALLYVLSLVIGRTFSSQGSYILALLITTVLMSFIVHSVRKAGSATLFYFFVGILTFNINNLGVTGLNKLIALLVAGLIFELIFLMFKIEIKNMQIDIIAGTAISTATIPITIGFLLSFNIAINMFVSIINLILLSFLIGIAGSIISFLIWYYLRTRRWILKFEYEQ